MTPAQSNTGIGQLGPALSGVDLSKLDESIYPDIEVFWQLESISNKVYESNQTGQNSEKIPFKFWDR